MTSQKKRICFIHPDLGLGGAERFIIDAAVGLQSHHHEITILTSHCDPRHCFDEARDGTLDVRVRGNAIFPPTINGRLKILLSILRQVALVSSVAVFSSELNQLNPDVFIVDQLSACVPLLRLLRPDAKVLFYGHFPDRLLAREGTGRTRMLKRVYRIPFDAIESWSTGCSDEIMVNSKFTRSVFRKTFASLRNRDLKVVYPCVDTEIVSSQGEQSPLWPDRKIFLSINRFDEKKNLDLALKAFAGLSPPERNKARLVVAGGYDQRVEENIQTHRNLQTLADSLDLRHATFDGQESDISKKDTDGIDVVFLLSVSESLKAQLLQSANLLLYTPSNEHFGIVPLEAMVAGVPVLATNTGGPLETIYDGRTGWTRSPDNITQWTDIMRKPLIPSSTETLQAMGQRGREHVLKEFSRTKLADVLDQEIQALCASKKVRPPILPVWIALMMLVSAVILLGSAMGAAMLSYVGRYDEGGNKP